MKVAVASGKGGTGKTTLSVNLASYIAQTRPVVLTDLDVEEPNSGLFIHGTSEHYEEIFRQVPSWDAEKCTLCGQCRDVCNFNSIIQMGDRILVFPELCHSCYACSELCPSGALPMVPVKMGELHHFSDGACSFIESRLDVGQEQAVPLIARTLSYVDETFATLGTELIKIYDSPPGTSCPVIEAVKNADCVLLVTEPTPFGLHDLSLAVETTRSLNKPAAVIVNRYGLGNADVESYCSSEGIEVIARLPNRRAIAELYSRGSLIYPEIPEYAAELEKIVRFIEGFEQGDTA